MEKFENRINNEELELIERAKDMNIDISFTLLEKKACSSGSNGTCCRQCLMGPCNTIFGKRKGICGADADTVVARNLLMMTGRGMSAHASHALHVATSLLKTAQNKTPYTIKDSEKLMVIAKKIKVDTSNGIEDTAIQVASLAIQDILSDKLSMIFVTSYFPTMACGIVPGSVGRELLEVGHETSMGTMADPTSLILHAVRLGIADITSLIISTELQDVLFGIPRPVFSRIGLGVLNKDKVNVVIHGHVPLIAEKIVELSEDKELLDKANSFGATGINIVGCCCTGNETLMRHGIPLVGSTLQQELIILTGLVEAFVVDVQCIYPNIEIVAESFHTKIITTMNEARIANAEHVPFTEEHADETAKRILDIAVENFPERGKIRQLLKEQTILEEQKIDLFLSKEDPKELMGGFSTEACIDILSRLNPDDPLKPLIDNIVSGNIYGIVLFAGCLNPRVTTFENHATIAKELMKRNVLIIATGCAAGACAQAGLLAPEASQYVGENLKNVLDILGKAAGLEKPLPPVLFFGSCVDNSRAITLITAIADRLGVSIKDLPIAASATECMAEKAVAIGIGAVGLGITVHVGVPLPTIGSPNVTALLTQKSETFGRFIVETDPIKASQQLLDHISNARTALGLVDISKVITPLCLADISNVAMPLCLAKVTYSTLSTIYSNGWEISPSM